MSSVDWTSTKGSPMPSPLDNSRPNDTAKETEMDTISSNGSGTNLTMITS
jgi:hypothetical protein